MNPRCGFAVRIRDVLVDRVLRLPPVRGVQYVVARNLAVPMPDGVILRADRYVPVDTGEGPQPVVLVRTPYGRSGGLALIYGAPFARRGYQVVIQSVRGTFGSGGVFRPFHDERSDGLATIAWLRSQPWCDGRVAMMGASYVGFTQWAVAPFVDPPLTALCPAITGSEFTSSTYLGGGIGLRGALEWSILVATQEAGTLRMALARALGARARRNTAALNMLPLSAADTSALDAASSYWQEVVAHAEPGDDFWRDTDNSAGLATMRSPVNLYTCWWDIFLTNALADVERLRKAGNPPRLTIGPGAHADVGGAAMATREALDHLGATLHGQAPRDRPPVLFYLQKADVWLGTSSWPPPADDQVWYLHSAGRLRTDAPAQTPPDASRYDPADPTPTIGGPVIGPDAGSADQAVVETRADVLTYTSPTLESDLDVVGAPTASVYLRSDPAYADLVVRLCDVDPDGRSTSVTDGYVRLRPESPPADVDGVVEVRLPLRATAYRFLAGHRLRVQVSGGAFPRYARNLGTGEPATTASRMVVARRETFHDPAYPSALSLPIRPRR
jgi:putative CocE/NonD family hydrolase